MRKASNLTGDLQVEVRLGGDHAPATASGEHGQHGHSRRLPWPVLPVALLLGALLVSAAVSGRMGYWHHGHHAGRFFPVLPLLVLAVASLRWIMRWRRGGLHR